MPGWLRASAAPAAALTAALSNPDGVTVDRAGDLLIADQHNNRIRLVAS
jgi:hypothetical protein